METVTVTGHWVDEPDTEYSVRVSLGSWDGQEFEVEADSEEQAQTLMLESFDISKADQGEGEIWDCEEITEGESK